MATNYIGDSIGDAARAEERGRERWLNLQLQNREFLDRQQARQDSINAQNAANAMSAFERTQALERADRNNNINTRLGLEERDYQRGQDTLNTLLGLDEAEKNRKLQRELNTLRNDNYIQRLQQTEDQRTYADIAKRIAGDEIRDIPALQDVEEGRLGSEEWLDLKARLGQHQSRMQQEAALGPEMAAAQASARLKTDPRFVQAKDDPATRRTIFDSIASDLARDRVFSGKVLPDYENERFNPVLNYKYSGPTDAIDWYRPGGPARTSSKTSSPSAAPAAPARDLSFLDRIGNGIGNLALDAAPGPTLPGGPSALGRLGQGYLNGMLKGAFPESRPAPVVPTPEPVAPAAAATAPVVDPIRRDPIFLQKLAEIQALVDGGMDKTEASELVVAKYRRLARGAGGSYKHSHVLNKKVVESLP